MKKFSKKLNANHIVKQNSNVEIDNEKFRLYRFHLSYDINKTKKYNNEKVRRWLVANLINIGSFDFDSPVESTMLFSIYDGIEGIQEREKFDNIINFLKGGDDDNNVLLFVISTMYITQNDENECFYDNEKSKCIKEMKKSTNPTQNRRDNNIFSISLEVSIDRETLLKECVLEKDEK